MTKKPMDREPHNGAPESVSRRAFLSKGAAGVSAAALTGVAAQDAKAQTAVKWDLSADLVIIGAGVAGLPAAITARDLGASVIIVDENFDIGGRGGLGGGRGEGGGGPALEEKVRAQENPGKPFQQRGGVDPPQSRGAAR